MAIRVGCGSWADAEYVGLLYSKGTRQTDRLRAYTHWFERVEVNSTYYAVPAVETVAKWVEQTPAHFLFDLKLPRAFSDDPRAAARSKLVERLFAAIQPLLDARRLGAFLLTLAPSFGPDRHQLAELGGAAEKLLPHAPLAVELRHRGWIDGTARDTTLEFFRQHGLTWVALDLPPLQASAVLPPIDEVTTPALAYLRLHGRNPRYLEAADAAARHEHDYTATELAGIVTRIHGLAGRAGHVHVSVNNHAHDFAPKAALALRRLLGQPVPSGPPVETAGDGQRSLFE